jgi:hypothetical protein
MGRIATALVAAAVLAVPNAAAKEGPLVPQRLLGFVSYGKTVSVVKLDASTLQPVSKAAPTGSTAARYVARSPGRGRRIALSTDAAWLRFLDLDTMRWTGRVRYPGVPQASLWNYANRLVTLTGTAEVIVADPTRGRLGTVRRIAGSLSGAYATTLNSIVAVVAPFDGIGPAKLALIDDTGHVRTAPLPEIRAGSESLDNASMFRFESPALAVDSLGKEAVVISPNGTIAEVRLDTMATTLHVSRTLAAVRKNANGSSRTARWLGQNTIAVTGGDASFDGATQRSTAAGLTLIDTRDWSSRTLDMVTTDISIPPYGNGCTVCSGILLAYGADGFAGYSFDGAQRFRLFQGTPMRPTFVAGSYAYLGYDRHYTIVDTFTGTVVRTVDTNMPTSFAAFAS